MKPSLFLAVLALSVNVAFAQSSEDSIYDIAEREYVAEQCAAVPEKAEQIVTDWRVVNTKLKRERMKLASRESGLIMGWGLLAPHKRFDLDQALANEGQKAAPAIQSLEAQLAALEAISFELESFYYGNCY